MLFQLPPKWKADPGRLREFLELLPREHLYAIEFRDDTWYQRGIYDLLQKHNVALCIHDWHTLTWAHELTANFSYVRFHGTGGRYAGNYPDPFLKKWATKIQSWAGRLNEVYVYFNNDVEGHAIRNARTLRAEVAKLSKHLSTPAKKPAA